MTKLGGGLNGANENDDDDEDYDDCVTVDGVQVGGQFGQKKQEKVFQYNGDDDDEDDYADQNFNPGISEYSFNLLCLERKSRGSSYFAKGGG